MQRSVLAVAMAFIMLLAVSVPASAQTWIQLRYTSANAQFNFAGATTNYTANLGGATIRHNLSGGTWGLSLNLDTGNDNVSTGVATTSTWWNVNLHRNFPIATGMFSLYAGWGSASWSANAISQTYSQQGLRIGADLRHNLPGNWYLTGDIGYGPWGNATTNNYILPGAATIQASVTDGRVGVGHMFGPWGLEGGYRWIAQTYTPGAGSCPANPCYDHWGGWYVGLGIMTP